VGLTIDWMGIAEGAVLDSRGAPTLVAMNQNVVTPDSLPAPWASAVFVFLAEEPEDLSPEGDISASIRLEFKSPSGEVISVSTQAVKNQRKYKDIPANIAMVAQVVLALQESGRYVIAATLKQSGDDEHTHYLEKYFYVIEANE
jgi:hypothetical protein